MTDFIKKSDGRYPERLKSIDDPPEKLYFKGSFDDQIFNNCLAVVGSRRMTEYGKRICTKLVRRISSRGITVVSGFMYGIDATAHRAVVSVGGRTIAVMPCGIDRIHPQYQKKLYKKIIEKEGLIISEYPKKKAPQKWTYPQRNRIVAGLSQATLVVQAAKESGSLITADYAEKFNRKIFSVPGPLTSKVSLGTAKLIKEGAEIVTCAEDIIDFYGPKQGEIDYQGKKPVGINLSEKEREIVEALNDEPLEADKISKVIGLPINKTGTILSTMQLKGLVEKEANKYYNKF